MLINTKTKNTRRLDGCLRHDFKVEEHVHEGVREDPILQYPYNGNQTPDFES